MLDNKTDKLRALLLFLLIVNITAISIAGLSMFSAGRADLSENKEEHSDQNSFYEEMAPENTQSITKEPIVQEEIKDMVLSIESIPSNAKVFLNGYLKGRTPFEHSFGTALEKKTYLLTIIKPGYSKYKKEIELRPGKINILQAELTEEN